MSLPPNILVSDEDAERHAADTERGLYDLTDAEKHWRDIQPFLESKGYMLRPRYHPGWTPTWMGTKRNPRYCEDSIWIIVGSIIDALRLRDFTMVCIKRTSSPNSEIEIAKYVTSVQDARNHCVPLLDVFLEPTERPLYLFVMPYLRRFDDPPFGAIGEVIDFVSQSLEGLVFLHEHRIAHRDIAPPNMMMDARPLYPAGHHPVRKRFAPDAMHTVVPLSRLDHPVRYFYIDFGLSVHFPEGAPTLAIGRKGRDKSVPELSSDIPYDALKVDIYVLGNFYQTEFLEKYFGLEFLQPLADAMRQPSPQLRPTAEAAMKMFEDIRAQLGSALLRWRLRSREESAPERVVYDTVAAAREGIYQIKRLIG